MSTMKCVLAIALFTVLSAAPRAQTVAREGAVTATATITATHAATRTLTLTNEKGEVDAFTAGPQVTRFNELKVGDKVRLTYYESLVLQLRKPGAASNSTGDTLAAGRTPTTPGGAIATQQTRTVTVKAVDAKAPSITVTTADGRTITRKVEDAKNLANVAVGDRIDITYSQAVAVTVEPAK